MTLRRCGLGVLALALLWRRASTAGEGACASEDTEEGSLLQWRRAPELHADGPKKGRLPVEVGGKAGGRCVAAQVAMGVNLTSATLPGPTYGAEWLETQQAAAAEFGTVANQSAPLRVLVVSSVVSDNATVATVSDFFERLLADAGHDIFHFGLFMLDGVTEPWAKRPWFADEARHVVLKRSGPHCKAEVWGDIDLALAMEHDYLWFVDADIAGDAFHWPLYRAVLQVTQPLVSQPAIIPRKPFNHASDHAWLNMKVSCGRARLLMAEEVQKPPEVMTPILSTHIWPFMHKRLSRYDKAEAWSLERLMLAAVQLARRACGRVGFVLVHGAPVRHLNSRLLWRAPERCQKLWIMQNLSPLEKDEVAALRGGLRDVCDIPANHAYLVEAQSRFLMNCTGHASGACSDWPREAEGGDTRPLIVAALSTEVE